MSCPSPLQRILVVDDSEPIRMLLADVLPPMGYTVTTACDGPTAMEELGRCEPQVVLMDIEMPGLDGCEVCRRIKSHPRTRSIPVMLVSGHPDTSDRAASAGADAFLQKPFQIDDLLKRISFLLGPTAGPS
jgi:CheY-like chemotaxis protein